ncbi:hypothetical protein D3C76_1769350 [compost metagenome]
MQAQFSALLALFSEQRNVLADRLLPFVRAQRLADNRRSGYGRSGRGAHVTGHDGRERSRW